MLNIGIVLLLLFVAPKDGILLVVERNPGLAPGVVTKEFPEQRGHKKIGLWVFLLFHQGFFLKTTDRVAESFLLLVQIGSQNADKAQKVVRVENRNVAAVCVEP